MIELSFSQATVLSVVVGIASPNFRSSRSEETTNVEYQHLMALRQDATSDASHEDDAEWESIARESLTNEELDAVAEYLRSTGQASA
jgi:hypothetical protein